MRPSATAVCGLKLLQGDVGASYLLAYFALLVQNALALLALLVEKYKYLLEGVVSAGDVRAACCGAGGAGGNVALPHVQDSSGFGGGCEAGRPGNYI
jgi:hypothetical protein